MGAQLACLFVVPTQTKGMKTTKKKKTSIKGGKDVEKGPCAAVITLKTEINKTKTKTFIEPRVTYSS